MNKFNKRKDNINSRNKIFTNEEELSLKATGIVRRIDELGRVVIPKEIRRTLRIREGDPLEIFTDREGGVILKKYSPIGELTDFSKEYAEALQQSIGHMVMICDKDGIISISGALKKEYIDKKLSDEIDNVINGRKTILLEENSMIPLLQDEEVKGKYAGEVIAPILAEGDAIGAVIIASKRIGEKLGNVEIKLAETAAAFLGKQMEQ
jgi:AbrB family transcriptional regulator (stage V sporulation protein T)